MKLPADWNESWSNREAAMYLVGHGSYTRPRLIELQYRQILRYREALAGRYEKGHSFPSVFIDFRLPRFGMGRVNLNEVPGFKKLCNAVRSHRCTLVYIDLDDTKEGLTPDYESATSSRRRNLADPVAEDVDYHDVRVDYRLSNRLRPGKADKPATGPDRVS